jgi:hypothetical protein
MVVFIIGEYIIRAPPYIIYKECNICLDVCF